MIVYLDNCTFNRPFDDQSQDRIKSETDAKLSIQDQVRNGSIDLAWSYVIDYEISRNPFADRQNVIAKWQAFAKSDIDSSDELRAVARDVSKRGIKPVDALHVGAAVLAKADYFITTDDGILRS